MSEEKLLPYQKFKAYQQPPFDLSQHGAFERVIEELRTPDPMLAEAIEALMFYADPNSPPETKIVPSPVVADLREEFMPFEPARVYNKGTKARAIIAKYESRESDE